MTEYRPMIRPSALRLMRRVKVGWPLGLCACLAVAYVAYFAYWTPFAAHYWAVSPARQLAQRADKLALSYEDVIANPSAAKGSPVRWHLGHHGSGEWYYRAQPGSPVRWSAAVPDLPLTGQSGSANSHVVVAIVVDADERGVVLNYVGKG